MKPDTSGWENPSAYDFIQNAAADSIAWEFLRRNEHYQKDYRDFQAGDGQMKRSRNVHRWGLSFRGQA